MGRIITFYSYKGGTGRSMVLANTAWLLAANGHNVLAIDWDLEAPGLHRYFKPFLVDPEMIETNGLIDAFWALATRALTDDISNSPPARPQETKLANLTFDFEDYISPIKWNFHGDGGIDFIGAGRQGATYSERVNTFDWKRFYQLGGGKFLDHAKASWTDRYEYVLIDSRTGVSDTSGICTIQLPDILAACFTLNNQSIEGVASILESVRAWRTGNLQHAKPPSVQHDIVLYPIATRIENSEKEKLDLARARAREVLQKYLPNADVRDARGYWDEMEITYRPFYAYEEILATFGDTSGAAGSAKTLLSEMEVVAQRVCERPALVMPEIPEGDRLRVVARYSFGTPLIARAPTPPSRPELLGDNDEGVLRYIYAKEVEWRLSGFRYQNLLSQREMQLVTPNERGGFGRQMSFYYTTSEDFSRFRGSLISFFVWIWLGLTIAASGYYFSLYLARTLWKNLGPPIDEIARQTFEIIANTLPVLLIIVLIFRVTLALLSSKLPYGVRYFDVFKLSVFGPFAPRISDKDDFQRVDLPVRR